MSDSLIFIFKTLWKLPFIFIFSYLILNVWSLFLVYFNINSAAFTIQQIVAQNNGIPDSYDTSVQELLKDIEANTGTKQITELSMELNLEGAPAATYGKTYTSTNHSGTYKPTKFGEKYMLTCNFNFWWRQPVKVGSTTKKGDTLITVSGDIPFTNSHHTPRTSGLVYTQGEKKYEENEKNYVNCKLYYEIPCIRYYPEVY